MAIHKQARGRLSFSPPDLLRGTVYVPVELFFYNDESSTSAFRLEKKILTLNTMIQYCRPYPNP